MPDQCPGCGHMGDYTEQDALEAITTAEDTYDKVEKLTPTKVSFPTVRGRDLILEAKVKMAEGDYNAAVELCADSADLLLPYFC